MLGVHVSNLYSAGMKLGYGSRPCLNDARGALASL